MTSPFTNRFLRLGDLLLLFGGGPAIPLTCSCNRQAPYQLQFGQCSVSAHPTMNLSYSKGVDRWWGTFVKPVPVRRINSILSSSLGDGALLTTLDSFLSRLTEKSLPSRLYSNLVLKCLVLDSILLVWTAQTTLGMTDTLRTEMLFVRDLLVQKKSY